MLSDFVQSIIIVLCINMIAVLGVSILTGFTNLFSFGNAGFMSIGAYTSSLLTLKLGVPFLPALAAGIIAAGIIAYLLGSITLKLKGDYFLITTLGFGECVRVLFNYIAPLTGGAKGMPGITKYTTFGVAVGSLVLAIVIAWTFVYSKYGRNLAAIREQEIAAEAVGINLTKYKRIAFVFSALFAGWAGVLFAHFMMYVTPAMFNVAKSSEMAITVVIGGIGSLTGSILGTILVTLLPEVFRSLANFRMLLYGIAVVVVIVLRPNGLFGHREFSITGIVRWCKRILSHRKKIKER